jgi:hypothetical protein
MRRLTAAAVLAVSVAIGAGCSNSRAACILPPCALPIAIEMSVTSAAGGPVEGLTVRISGAAMGTGSCSAAAAATMCFVPGVAGTYVLDLVATGFQPAQRTVTVPGTTPECGCPTVERVHLDVVLSPNPSSYSK